jgi:hypothetical protein
MSLSQLKALAVLAASKNGIVEAEDTSKKLGLTGKSLGGVFSSLSRQNINGQALVLPRGRSVGGRGLRWVLNEKVISKDKLKQVVREVLG